MRFLRKLRLRIRSLLAKQSVEEDLEAELRDYMEREMDAKVAGGMLPDEARRSVIRNMQGKTQLEEKCRDARGTAFFEHWLRDMRYGWRTLRKNLGFSVTAVLTLAFGIGISTTLFSLAESQLWRPLPFPHSERLMVLWERNLTAE